VVKKIQTRQNFAVTVAKHYLFKQNQELLLPQYHPKLIRLKGQVLHLAIPLPIQLPHKLVKVLEGRLNLTRLNLTRLNLTRLHLTRLSPRNGFLPKPYHRQGKGVILLLPYGKGVITLTLKVHCPPVFHLLSDRAVSLYALLILLQPGPLEQSVLLKRINPPTSG